MTSFSYALFLQGLTVNCALSRAKAHIRKMKQFHEPLYWAMFSIYGQDSMINLEELRRNVAEASFFKAQILAVERFELAPRNKGNTRGLNIP
jgi:N-glycosylase/DNA lyase